MAMPNLGIPPNPRDRSPSPEPIHNSKGVRMNTRYERTKAKLVSQRNNYITKLKALDPTYQPPACFQYKNSKLEDRVEVPQDEHPQYNFMGLILGPRGDSLDEPMHVVINGPTPEAVKDASDHIRKLIKQQIEDPDGETMVALRASHMHELAVLNR